MKIMQLRLRESSEWVKDQGVLIREQDGYDITMDERAFFWVYDKARAFHFCVSMFDAKGWKPVPGAVLDIRPAAAPSDSEAGEVIKPKKKTKAKPVEVEDAAAAQ